MTEIRKSICITHFKSIFLSNPKALAHFICTIIGIDYNTIKDNLIINFLD